MEIFTIGFTQTPAAEFFGKLTQAGVRRLIDVRLNNTSQLAAYAKRDDLRFFLREICGLDYVHMPDLAPTQEILDAYRKRGGDWAAYEREFLELMTDRRIEDTVPRELIADGCLLCSEDKPHHCHRRLVAEYLKDRWGDLEIVHL